MGSQPDQRGPFPIQHAVALQCAAESIPTMPCKPISLQNDTHTEDDSLMQRVASGDRQAFHVLYQRYLPRLIRYLRTRLPHPELIEDVCQDVFLVVWQQAPRFRGQSRVSTWLFGIARRQALKVLATRQCPDPLLESVALPDPPPPAVSLSMQERCHALGRALATLPPSQRQIVEMAYYQDRSYGDIADCLGCSVTTVKIRLRHARRRLGVQLTRENRPTASPRARAACYRTMTSPSPLAVSG